MEQIQIQLPESENDRVIRMLRAAVSYDTITPAEAGAYYSAYLDIIEEELTVRHLDLTS